MYAAFHQELAKIGAVKQKGYAASVLAHELGHAQDFENRSVPKLRRAVELGVGIGGSLGALGAALAGRPGTAALMSVGSNIPTLLSEAEASFRGISALEKDDRFTAAEKQKMRKHLYSAGATYLAQTGLHAGLMSGAGAMIQHGTFGKLRPRTAVLAGLGFAGSAVAAGLASKAFKESAKEVPILSERNAQNLRKEMKVRAQLYEGKGLKGNALFMPGKTVSNPGNREIMRRALPHILADKNNKRIVETILTEGGVIQGKERLKRKVDLERVW